uniref:Apolipoprotein L3 n=1 Tax=Magallana gigas TaxID=29159 RepID=K1PS79_MAGGI|eukprot:XP_019929251.1 PREDICTED: apolipoprotein L3 [Crassostrea gigas]
MDYQDSFAKVRHFYDETWAPERRKVLKELECIRDKIQQQAEFHSVGSIAYSGVGLVGGGLAIAGIITAPFTFGISFGLTVAGVSTGVASGVAGITHGAVKFGKVKKQIDSARTNLENHEKHCKEMTRLLELLEQDIETIKEDNKGSNELKNSYLSGGLKQIGPAVVAKGIVNVVSSKVVDLYRITGKVHSNVELLRIVNVLDDTVLSPLNDITKGVTTLSAKALSVLTAIGIVIDMWSLYRSAADLSKFKKGQLCSEAEKLQNVIEQMQHQYDILTQCFS